MGLICMAKQQKTNKKIILLDLIFYLVFPYVIWKFGKDSLGDYLAMLLSTVPGFVYTIYRFILEKQFNIAGLFIIGSLALSTTVDLLSGSAERMLWNSVYVGLFFAMIHFLAFIIKRPFALYFAVDFAYLQGYERKASTHLFYQQGIFRWFQLIQILFIVRSLFFAILKVWLLQTYGVEGYDSMLIYRQIASWFFTIVITGMFIYSNVPIQKYFANQKKQVQ